MDIIRKSILILASFLVLAAPAFSQDKEDDNIVLWSADRNFR